MNQKSQIPCKQQVTFIPQTALPYYIIDIFEGRLFKLSDKQDFQKLYPELDISEQTVFALDLIFQINSTLSLKHRFHIVAEWVVASECLVGDARPNVYYKDPFEAEGFACFKNRVL